MAKRKNRLEGVKLRIKRPKAIRINFTENKLGSKTDRGRKIVKCPSCNLKGELSGGARWGNSVLIIHRGVLKQEVFSMTEQCMVARHLMGRIAA